MSTLQASPKHYVSKTRNGSFHGTGTSVFVDKPNCTSCGLCAETNPQYFRMDDDDLAESHNLGSNVNDAAIAADDRDSVQVAIEDCPGECIHWKKPETNPENETETR